MPHRTYNTPKRKCVVKTRLTEDERRAFEDKCAALSMSQSEYIRQAVFYSRISPVIRVTAHSEEMLTAVSSLVAQYGKIGSNLNQIARYLNEYGTPYNALSGEVRAAVSDLAALKFEVLKVIGEVYASRQYRLPVLGRRGNRQKLPCGLYRKRPHGERNPRPHDKLCPYPQ